MAPRSCFTGRWSTMPIAKARELELENGYVFVHAVRRSGTSSPGPAPSALEMLEDAPDLDCIVVPIGGGGLMSGIATAAKALKPDIEMIGVEAELYPSMKCAVEGCQPAARRRHAGRRHCGQAAGRAHPAHPQGTGRRFRAGRPNARSSRRWRCWSGSRRRVVEGAGAAGLAAILDDPGPLQGQEGRHRAVRRQYRHASARQRC